MAVLSRAPRVRLTRRSLLALQLVAVGYTTQEIGQLTGNDAPTVREELARAQWVLRAKDVEDAVATAHQRGLIIAGPHAQGGARRHV